MTTQNKTKTRKKCYLHMRSNQKLFDIYQLLFNTSFILCVPDPPHMQDDCFFCHLLFIHHFPLLLLLILLLTNVTYRSTERFISMTFFNTNLQYCTQKSSSGILWNTTQYTTLHYNGMVMF